MFSNCRVSKSIAMICVTANPIALIEFDVIGMNVLWLTSYFLLSLYIVAALAI